MRRLLPLLLLLLAPAALRAQDTVTGHVTLPSGTAPSNVKVCFTLGNFSPNAPKVINTGTLVAVKNFCIQPAADGSYSTSLFGNDTITPISTNWRVDFLVNGQQQSSATYYINHTPFNLDSEVPLSVSTPAGPNQMVTQAFPFTQVTPATTWTITHNFNDVNTIVIASGVSGSQIFPDDTNCRANPNVCTLTFVTATAGFAIAMHAGAINIATTQPNAVVQNPTGTQAVTGSLTVAGLTVSGPGVYTCKNLAAVRCVDLTNTAGWTGNDVGAWINSAYADLPASGGRIRIAGGASCYVATTAISFGIAGKPVLLEGDPGGPTCISYATASTSIVAVTLDYLSGPPQAAAGIRDIKFIGPGAATTSVGIKLGVANGAPYSVLSGIAFGSNGGATDGFGTNVAFNFNSYSVLIEKSQIQNATTGIAVSSGSESLRIDASSISHNTTGLSCNNGSDVYMWGHSIDDNSTGVSISGGCRVELHGVHFENVFVSAGSAAYAVCTGGELLFYGGQMQDDQVSGTTAQFIQANSGNCNIGIFGTLVHTLGRTLTQIVNFNGAGSGRGWLMPFYFSANVLSDFNQAYTAGPVFDLPMGTGSGPNNTAGFFGTTLQFRNSSGFISGPGANPYNLTVNNPATSRALSISDPGGAAAFVFDLGAQSLSSKSFVNPAFLSVLGGNTYNFNVINPASARNINVTDPGATSALGLSYNTGSAVYQSKRGVAGCTTAASIGGVCGSPITVTWTTAFPDMNYSVTCTPTGAATNLPSAPYVSAKAAGNATVNYFAISAAAASWPTIDCTAIHD